MKRSPYEKKSTTGILTLLEQKDGDTRADTVEKKCVKISETIYRCLRDCSCRHKFHYDSISLCSWPRPGDPHRAPDTVPCDTSGNDPRNDG